MEDYTKKTLIYIVCVWISAAIAALLYVEFHATHPELVVLMGVVPVLVGLALSPMIREKAGSVES